MKMLATIKRYIKCQVAIGIMGNTCTAQIKFRWMYSHETNGLVASHDLLKSFPAMTPGFSSRPFEHTKTDASRAGTHSANPPLATNEGLDRYFGVLNNHLSPAGLLGSHASPLKTNPGSVGQSGTLKRLLIGPDGQRLPSVAKKPLPLPPEDVRAVPHIRSPTRVGSPPVVSVGRIDNEGIPIPWTRTPELLSFVGVSSKDVGGHRKSSPSADDLRQTIRDDFDALETFIEQAFSSCRVGIN